MTLGLYVPGRSPLHRLSADIKMAGLLGLSLALYLQPSPALACAGLALSFAAYLSTGIPFRRLVAELRGPAILLAFVFGFHLLSGTPEEGALAVMRFAALILLASAVTLTTPISEMADLVERVLQPLRPVGVSPEKVALAIALAIRFIPLIASEFREIREAQDARGLGRNPLALVVPLVLRTLRAADALADAIEARGYEG